MVYLSFELLVGEEARPKDPKMTAADHVMNNDTKTLLKTCINELSFVVNVQPSPLHHCRLSDALLASEKGFMRILSWRPKISAAFFKNDQLYWADVIHDYQRQLIKEYQNLYDFCRHIEYLNALEGFRHLFDLPEVEESQKTAEEKKEEHFIRRKYQFVNGTEKSWLYRAMLYYNTWNFINDRIKTKLFKRYAHN